MALRTVLLLIALAAAPATTRTSDMEPLCDGTVRYTPPAGWTLVEKNPNDLVATYKLDDPASVITITVIPQDRAVAESSKDGMAKVIAKAIREASAREKHPMLDVPRQVDDPRFFLKMHDSIKVEGKIVDRIQLYRVIGLNLVHVACSATVDAVEQSRPAFEAAENLMAGMKLSRGSVRALYPKAQLRAIVPTDWTEKRFDQPNGAVATYADPKNPIRQLLLNARIIPKAALKDRDKSIVFLENMMDKELAFPPSLRGMKVEESEVPLEEKKKLVRHTRMKLTGGEGEPMRVETRYLVVGDVLASVRSITREPDADAMNVIAERLAASLKPVKD